jgi:hypothetical protein
MTCISQASLVLACLVVRRYRVIAIWAAFALGAALMVLTSTDSATGLLYLLPALLLSVPLLARRYPGEARLAARVTSFRRRTRRPVSSVRKPTGPQRLVARGSLLIARSLAVRPPPGAPAFC